MALIAMSLLLPVYAIEKRSNLRDKFTQLEDQLQNNLDIFY